MTATATATDGAGNSTTVSQTFTIDVLVDVEGVVQLTRERVTKPGAAKALVATLRTGAYGACVNHLRAQSGKSISPADADLLGRLAQLLG